MRDLRRTTGLLYGLLSLAAVVWIAAQGRGLGVRHPAPWLELPFPLAVAASLAGGLGIAVGVAVATRVLVRRGGWARRLHVELRGLLGGVDSDMVAFLALASGTAEELFFRAAMLPALGLGWSSLIFGAVHLPMRRALVPWTLWAVSMGVVFGVLYQAFGSLAGCVLAHAAINYWNLGFLLAHDPDALPDGTRRGPSGSGVLR